MRQVIVKVLTVIAFILIVLFMFLQLISFRIEVPTGSMLNTIQLHQQLLVLKDRWVTEYKRGDIIVFEQDGTLLIKRLIGMPGETVRITDGTVYIDGKMLFEDYISSNCSDYDGVFYVPDEEYFFLGDNRVDSFDARQWEIPYVKGESLRGKAIYYVYPKIESVQEVTYATN